MQSSRGNSLLIWNDFERNSAGPNSAYSENLKKILTKLSVRKSLSSRKKAHIFKAKEDFYSMS